MSRGPGPVKGNQWAHLTTLFSPAPLAYGRSRHCSDKYVIKGDTMRRLKVGDQLYEGVAGFEEGTHYNYTLAGHTLIISIKNPLPEHITAVSGGEAVFGLATRDRTAFVLCRFGNLPWRIAHYNWWINPPVLRPDPWGDLETVDSGVYVTVTLVDAADGIVKALRLVRLAKEFSRMFLLTVETQTKPSFDPWRYLEVVESVIHGDPEIAALLRQAVCVCTCDEAGDLSPKGGVAGSMPS